MKLDSFPCLFLRVENLMSFFLGNSRIALALRYRRRVLIKAVSAAGCCRLG
jgi:hypothetical protein